MENLPSAMFPLGTTASLSLEFSSGKTIVGFSLTRRAGNIYLHRLIMPINQMGCLYRHNIDHMEVFIHYLFFDLFGVSLTHGVISSS